MDYVSVFIVEDDEILASEIKDFLNRWGYKTVLVSHFDDIMHDFLIYRPHLVLMDINLPYFDGFYWCRQIRLKSDVPLIYISSRNDDRDKIMAMAQGGDDYIEKPFHLELLKAKIEAVLRRAYQYKVSDRFFFNERLYFESSTSSLFYQDKVIELTKSEQKIMTVLIAKRPAVVSREDLMMALWNTDEFVSDGTLTTLISRLRNKLKAVLDTELIHTKKGQGYFIA